METSTNAGLPVPLARLVVLLPCPFCGAAGTYPEDMEPIGELYCQCSDDKCRTFGPSEKTWEEAGQMWNRRTRCERPRRSMERLVRLPSVERGCNGKTNLGRSYAKQADKLAAKHGKKYGVYRCPHCGGTHLTTKLEKSESYAPLIHISEPNAGAGTWPGAPLR